MACVASTKRQSYSRADGWIYGHGTFMLCTHGRPVLGLFLYMPNAAHEAKLMERMILPFSDGIATVCMDSKADDQALYDRLKQRYGIQLLTAPRKAMDKSASRRQMIAEMAQQQRLYKERSVSVEPLQGLMAEVFELDRCWRRGYVNNRWLFAAMGVARQMAQWHATREQKSTWKVKVDILGIG